MFRKVLLACIIVSVFLNLKIFSQDDETLLRLIQEEQESLLQYEREIQYFYNLINRRNEVKTLYKDGYFKEINKAFSDDTYEIDHLFLKDNITDASLKIGELKTVYKDVPELKDEILFYRGKISFYRGKIDKARSLLEDIVTNYTSSKKRNQTIHLLEDIYFREELHQEFIDIFHKYTQSNTSQQKFWLAQSYYNLDDLENAKIIFSDLIGDDYYGFRAECMLALMKYFTEGINQSINAFLNIQTKYGSNTEYYDFVILSLARLYSEKDDMIASLENYELYAQMWGDDLGDDITFEIASQYKNNEDYDKAIGYYYRIINNPGKSQYYASAKFLVMLVEMERGNFDQVGSRLNEMISVNDLLLETLNSKYDLLEKYAEIKTKIASTDITEAERSVLNQKKLSVEKALETTNKTMYSLYSGMDPMSLQILELIEEEYLSYNSTINEMSAVIKLANTVPNKRIPRKIDSDIEMIDLDLITLQMINYLGHLPQITSQDYELAKALAQERLYEEYLLEAWNEIGQLAGENHPNISRMVESSKGLLRENLASLDKIAESGFSGKAPEETRERVNEVSKAIERNREELIVLKKNVIEKFNKQIAKRLSVEKELLVEENEVLKSTYNKALDSIKDEVQEENEKFNVSLLDVLFKQTQNRDEEYKELQGQIKK